MSGVLDGKITLITGAGSGIGRATALAFAREGATVVVSDVVVDGGEETVQLIQAAGGAARFLKVDVSQSAEVEGLISQVVETYGRLDCAYNNAGVGGENVLTAEVSEEGWDRTMAVNLKGVWLCMKYEILQMLKQGGGSIVNTSSAYGLVGGYRLPDYIASKHGVVGITRAAALEYAQSGIRVNCVCPGAIETPMVTSLTEGKPEMLDKIAEMEPVGRMGQPQEIAESVVWLSSDAASFVTGHAMSADGGWLAQ